MSAFFNSIDTILWGRKTYEVALGFTRGRGVGYGLRVKNYVFSRRPLKQLSPDVELVRQPIRAFARRLRATRGKDIWMMGGAGLIASFLDAGEIDEFIVHVIPTFIGEGIPLVAPRRPIDPAAPRVFTPIPGRRRAAPIRRGPGSPARGEGQTQDRRGHLNPRSPVSTESPTLHNLSYRTL